VNSLTNENSSSKQNQMHKLTNNEEDEKDEVEKEDK
jgi:hypothetical protein